MKFSDGLPWVGMNLKRERLTKLDQFALRSRSIRTTSLKRSSKACLRARTVQIETQMALPDIMRRKSKICCHVVISLRLTVFSPVSVIAETTKNKECIADSLGRMGRAPEDEGGKQADNDEVDVMNVDEVDGRQDGTKPQGGALVSSTPLHGV